VAKSSYKPIPVGVAAKISEEFAKSMVVILAYDPVHQLTHTVSYGVDASNSWLMPTRDDLVVKRWDLQAEIDRVLARLPEVRYWREDLWGPKPYFTHLLARLPSYKQLASATAKAKR
jgi:hypothetical protein